MKFIFVLVAMHSRQTHELHRVYPTDSCVRMSALDRAGLSAFTSITPSFKYWTMYYTTVINLTPDAETGITAFITPMLYPCSIQLKHSAALSYLSKVGFLFDLTKSIWSECQWMRCNIQENSFLQSKMLVTYFWKSLMLNMCKWQVKQRLCGRCNNHYFTTPWLTRHIKLTVTCFYYSDGSFYVLFSSCHLTQI